MDRSAFFRYLTEVDARLFPDGMSDAQQRGLTVKLTIWDAHYSAYPDSYLAAALGQIHRETGGRMEPVLEAFAADRSEAAQRLQAAFDSGRLSWVKTPYWQADESGQIAVGGGDIQLTHRRNYLKAEAQLAKRGIACGLAADYDRILDPVVSAHVAFCGMIEGWFRPCRLADFDAGDGRLDYRAARDVVNGDGAHIGDEIVRNCEIYAAALRAGGGFQRGRAK
ncbi:hypothetical protein [Pseudohoeflea coraliihabitans]|uniref:Glycoside hydrolase family 19 catalytic domain-containing protein n=1 Tax=Pseudohoeflea coraliihabitans TaxID=2860393 RepID=A0ABS6WQ05_9HYPH|nr:hypothetical protein [Pseudohoeflea sp. DP4N28-3]MBW3098042.1 hypothetical protein [Pseudohoeflea sp. DP4N28-3]